MKSSVKNPFGETVDMATMEEEDSDNQNLYNIKNNDFQDDYVKNELAKKGISEESLKLGLNMGKQLVKNSKFVDYFSLEGLKPYFQIDNRYVLIKLRYLFLPFLKDKSVNNNELQFKYNIEYPDLYLPIMSFITYVLSISFMTAIKNPKNFTPQTLGRMLSKDFSLYIINACFVKLLMFIFLNNPLSFTDICSIVGYKFVYMVIYSIFSIFMTTKTIRYIIFVLFSLLSGLFIRKCLNKKLSNESFKRTIIYSSLATDIFVMFLMLLDS